jgi:hypothetical protein
MPSQPIQLSYLRANTKIMRTYCTALAIINHHQHHHDDDDDDDDDDNNNNNNNTSKTRAAC